MRVMLSPPIVRSNAGMAITGMELQRQHVKLTIPTSIRSRLTVSHSFAAAFVCCVYNFHHTIADFSRSVSCFTKSYLRVLGFTEVWPNEQRTFCSNIVACTGGRF